MQRNLIWIILSIVAIGCSKQTKLSDGLINGTWKFESDNTVGNYVIKGGSTVTYNSEGRYISEADIDVFLAGNPKKIATLSTSGEGRWKIQNNELVMIAQTLEVISFQSDDASFTRDSFEKTKQQIIGAPIHMQATKIMSDHIELKDYERNLDYVMTRATKRKP